MPYPSIAKVKAMVDTKTVDVDLVELDGKDLEILSNRSLLEKIDYSVIPKDTLDGLKKVAIHPNGIGMFVWPMGITYNTKKFTADNHPRNWTEFWDVKKFPGARTLPEPTYLIGPIEMALMANGVPPDKLYPSDLDRAFKSLERIKPSVAKWYKGSAESAQIVSSGNADLGANTFGRIINMKKRRGADGHRIQPGAGKNRLLDGSEVRKALSKRDEIHRFLSRSKTPGRICERLSGIRPYQ